jgi:hypothetical protein
MHFLPRMRYTKGGYGGYSSVAERRSVAADVVGSKPTSRPNLLSRWICTPFAAAKPH